MLTLQVGIGVSAPEVGTLPGTQTLNLEGDLSAQMVAGIDTFLMRQLDLSIAARQKLWQRDLSSRDAYEKSVQPNRERFRKIIGATDPRSQVTALEYVNTTTSSAKVAETPTFTVWAVRWPVFEGVYGEGLLLQPKTQILARIVALSDADQTPEQLVGLSPALPADKQFARRLAENGCQVLIPVLIDRRDTHSGNARLNRFTNQPHREWIYRQAFEMGRHIIGYEVQKVLAAVDWFASQPPGTGTPPAIGLAGYGEGGLLALYTAALDTRIAATLVSGYYDSRQHVWSEPIYRNIFGLLHEFGDAEIASLIAPRRLFVEHSDVPAIDGPPPGRAARSGAAPGKWTTPDFNSVAAEVERANALVQGLTNHVEIIHGTEGMTTSPMSEAGLVLFTEALGCKNRKLPISPTAPSDARVNFSPDDRQQRQIEQLVEHTQRLLRFSETTRGEFFWARARSKSPDTWLTNSTALKANFWEEVIGKLPKSDLALKPTSRKVYEETKWTGYDVVLDVYPDVFAWGVLLLPKDLKPGERRPVVVCQHGLEGLPEHVLHTDPKQSGFLVLQRLRRPPGRTRLRRVCSA